MARPSRFPPLLLAGVGFAGLAALIWILGPTIAFGDSRPLADPGFRVIASVGLAGLMLLGLLAVELVAGSRRERLRHARLLAARQASREATQPPPQPAGEADRAAADPAGPATAAAAATAATARGATPRTDRDGPAAPAALPWVVLLGDAGVGKAALAAKARLTPADPPTGRPADLGAIALLAGDRLGAAKVTTDPATRGALGDRLARLRRHLAPAPVTGIVLTIDIATLIDPPQGDLLAYARALRGQVDAAARGLKGRTLVYLVVHKADRLIGMAPLVGALDRDPEAGLLGWTFGRDGAGAPQIDRGLGRLADHLRRRASDAAQRLGTTAARGAAWLAVRHVERLAPSLAQVTAVLARPNGVARPTQLRGVYFIGSDRGSPAVDTLPAPDRQRYGLPDRPGGGRAAAAIPATADRLFDAVIAPEAGLANTQNRRRTVLRVAGLALLLALIVAAALTARAVDRRFDRIAASNAATADALAGVLADLPDGPISDSDPMPVLPILERLQAVGDGFPPPPDWWPQGAGWLPTPPAQTARTLWQEAAQAQARNRLLPRAALRLEEAIADGIAAGAVPDDLLAAYRSLTAGGTADPTLAPTLLTLWTGDGGPSGATAARLQPILALALTPPRPAVPANAPLLQAAQDLPPRRDRESDAATPDDAPAAGERPADPPSGDPAAPSDARPATPTPGTARPDDPNAPALSLPPPATGAP